MSFTITCTKCGRRSKSAKPVPAGTMLNCPGCHERFRYEPEGDGTSSTPSSGPPPLPKSKGPPPLPGQRPAPAADPVGERGSGGWFKFVCFVVLLFAAAGVGVWYFAGDKLPDLRRLIAGNAPRAALGNEQEHEKTQNQSTEGAKSKDGQPLSGTTNAKTKQEVAEQVSSDKPINAQDMAFDSADLSDDIPEELHEADDYFPRRKLIIPRVNGEPHGSVRHYGPQRRLICVDHYIDGLLTKRRTFFPSGKPFSLVTYEQGKPHGVARNWFEDGNLSFTMTWDHGVQNGPSVVYGLNGQRATESNLVNGIAQGERKHYLPDGRLFGTSQFQDGVEVNRNVLIEPTIAEFQAIDQRSRYSLHLKDHWTARQIEAEREKGTAPHDPNKKTGEWVALFNGKNLNGWWPTVVSKENVTWEVRDGLLVGSGQKRMGYLYRDEDDYGNFKLRAEVRINSTGNSGIMLRGRSEGAFETGWPQGMEVQLAIADKTLKSGGLYIQGVAFTSEFPSNRSNPASKPEPDAGKGKRKGRSGPSDSSRTLIGNTNELHHAADEWFTVEVQVQGKDVAVTINGSKTAEGMIEAQPDLVPPKGFIGLQLHPMGPTTVEFRKIEVMRLE